MEAELEAELVDLISTWLEYLVNAKAFLLELETLRN